MNVNRHSGMGFTLVELLITLTILGSLSFVLVLNLFSGQERIKQKGVAQTVLTELDSARALAQQQQGTVAVAFDRQDARHLIVFQGEEKLKPLKTVRVSSEGAGTVLWATWPGYQADLVPPSSGAPDLSPLEGRHYILFYPDGRVESDGPTIDDRTLLTTCSSYKGSEEENGWIALDGIDSPQIIALHSSGSALRLEQLPGGLAEVGPSGREVSDRGAFLARKEGEHTPVIQSLELTPTEVGTARSLGVGRSYIEIHPTQTRTNLKRFGTVSLKVRATDGDGGPLFLNATCEPSDGEPGSFANVDFVRMEYIDGAWEGVLSWMPPPEAVTGLEYQFKAVVEDPTGLRSESGDASELKATIDVLQDVRLVIETDEGVLYLCNMDGGESVRLTPEGVIDSEPFWTADGTAIFAVSQAADKGVANLVRYSADGAEREVVVNLPADVVSLEVDPFGFYIAYLGDGKEVQSKGSGDDPGETKTLYTLFARHIEWRGKSTELSDAASSDILWNPSLPGTLQYTNSLLTENDEQFMNEFIAVQLLGVDAKPGGSSPANDSPKTGAVYNPRWVEKFVQVKERSGDDLLALYRYDNGFRIEHIRDLLEDRELPGFSSYALPQEVGGGSFGLGTGASSSGSLGWSNNGLHLAVPEEDLAGELLVLSFRDDLTGTPDTRIAFKGLADKYSFQLSPDGDLVYYIDRSAGTGRLMRCPIGGSPVRVAPHVKEVKSFALSN